MRRTENECVDCGLPCIGDSCQHRRVTRFYCDECGEEAQLYEYEDRQLCGDCLLNEFKIVEGSEE